MLKKYNDIADTIKFVETHVQDEDRKKDIILMLNELRALRLVHDVDKIKSNTKVQGQCLFEGGKAKFRTGLYEKDALKSEEVMERLAKGTLVDDDVLIIKSDSIAKEVFDPDATKKKASVKGQVNKPPLNA